MENRNLLVALGVVLIVILAAGFFYFQNNSQTNIETPTPVTEEITTQEEVSITPTSSPSGEEVMQKEENSVTITQSGYQPSSITIKAGSTVTFINKSGTNATVNSDPHPVHTLWPFINSQTLTNGATHIVTFEDAGTYTYHNHLNSSQKGTVIVQ